LADELRALSESLGNPGAEALFTAAKRKKLAVSRKQVQEFVRTKGEKQVLGPPQRAAGKTVSEANNRWQMDLVDVSNVPAGNHKFFLIVVNVFDRFMWARPLTAKTQKEVATQLADILAAAERDGRKIPQVLSSDNGTEFVNPEVKKVLDRKRVAQKFKDAGDLNALGLVDRQIGLLKRRLAEMHATNKKSWAENLQAAVAALNKTPKPDVLHGAAPEEVRDDPEVKFMMYQDTARAIKHNQRLTERRTAAVERTGTFRPQTTLSRFKRNFQATYGDPDNVRKVEAGRVHGVSGTYPLKQIKVVPAGAGEVRTSETSAANRKMELGGALILDALAKVLEGQEQMALTKAAVELRKVFTSDGRDYNATLRRVGGRLIDLIRLDPASFKLIPRPHGPQKWYFVSLT
jgi:transposase InsO family protein